MDTRSLIWGMSVIIDVDGQYTSIFGTLRHLRASCHYLPAGAQRIPMRDTSSVIAGRYELLDIVGATGLASVYRARDAATDSIVAVKLFRSYFSQESEALQRYTQVIQRAQTLRHPNIVRVHGVEREEASLFVIMEYVPWPSLRNQEAQTPSLHEVLTILRQVAAALDYAHEHGMVHRDLKPGNILYDRESGQVKVSDFGTATLVEGGHLLIRTTVSTPLPSYTAPEQIQGKPPDPRNDIYSMGALLYELTTGSLPFDALSPYTVLTRQLTTTIRPPSEFNPSLPSEFDAALLKALSRRPGDRYASGAELVAAVEAAVGAQHAVPTTVPVCPDVAETAKKPAELEDARIVCPHCGAGNPATTPRCFSCWGSLTAQPTVTKEEEQRLVQRYLRVIRRRKRIIWSTIGTTFAVLIGLFLYNLFDLRPALPTPASEISSISATGEWAMLQHNPTHTGMIPGPAFVPEGKLGWQFSTEGPLFSTPAVADGRIYYGTSDRGVIALDADTGDFLWAHPVLGPVNSSPAVAGDLVFVGLRDGDVLALNKATGDLEWSFDAGSGVYSSPVVLDGTLYIGSGDSNIYALDAATGHLRWKRETDGWVVSSPAVSDGIVAVGGMDGRLYLIRAANGVTRFHFGTGNSIGAAVTVVGDTAYVPSGLGNIFAVDLKKRDIPYEKGLWKTWFTFWVWGIAPEPPRRPGLVWARESREGLTGHLATDGERLFAAYRSGSLRAHDLNRKGRVLWEFDAGAPLRAAPIVSGNTVIQPAFDGKIHGVDKSSGEKLWELSVEGGIRTSPALANGVLYIASNNGTLYALE